MSPRSRAVAIIRNRVGEEVSGRAVPRGEHRAIFSNILKHSADFLRSLTDCRVRGRDDVRVPPPPPHAFGFLLFLGEEEDEDRSAAEFTWKRGSGRGVVGCD